MLSQLQYKEDYVNVLALSQQNCEVSLWTGKIFKTEIRGAILLEIAGKKDKFHKASYTV